MEKIYYPLRMRLTALLLVLICTFGLIPTTAFAAGDTIKLKDFGYTGVTYESAALGRAQLHQMYFQDGTTTTVGFCGTKGGDMGNSLRGQTWGNKAPITDPTVITMMAYFYSHANSKFTDEAIAMGENNVWSEAYCWRMNAWVQAIIWRYKQGLLSDPVVACAEELMAVGAKEAYRRLKTLYPNVCLVHLYCLEGAITQTEYNCLSKEKQRELREFSDSLK